VARTHRIKMKMSNEQVTSTVAATKRRTVYLAGALAPVGWRHLIVQGFSDKPIFANEFPVMEGLYLDVLTTSARSTFGFKPINTNPTIILSILKERGISAAQLLTRQMKYLVGLSRMNRSQLSQNSLTPPEKGS